MANPFDNIESRRHFEFEFCGAVLSGGLGPIRRP